MPPTNIEWRGDDTLYIDGLCFKMNFLDYTARTNESEIIILKDRGYVELYRDLIESENAKRVLEVGFFEGGSLLLFAALFPNLQISGVDLRNTNEAVLRHAERYKGRAKFHYHTSQDNESAIRRIVAEDFDAPLDIVIDDASHLYEPTRRCFEICFPLLKPGGKYVIEDWAWAHWPAWQDNAEWRSRPAMSNIVYELAVASATMQDVVANVSINTRTIIVTKGPKPIDRFDLSAAWLAQGRERPVI